MVDFRDEGTQVPLDFDAEKLEGQLAKATAATALYGKESRAVMRDVVSQHRAAATSGRDFARTLTASLRGAIRQGKSFSDTLRDMALAVSELALKAALKSVGSAVGTGIAGVFGGITGSAMGNVIAGNRIRPFARGGIVNSPLLFPLRGGTGLAGEAGPEAILPLSRGPDGRLGVATQQGGAPVSITFNVTARDAESFRRSETQIAALLTRATARGNRNL